VLTEEDLQAINESHIAAIRPMMQALNAICSAVPVSNASDRGRHQTLFKQQLRIRYQCTDPQNPAVTKCMVLDHFFGTDVVKASHIVGLYERNICGVLGIVNVWDPRNGLLLHTAIDKKFEAMEVVSLKLP
jgi:hypothetical protein